MADQHAEPNAAQVTLGGYLGAYAALVLLATASLLLSRIEWRGDLVVAMVIAGIKTILVLWLFMHLAEERSSSRYAVLVAVLLIALLVGLSAADVATRHTFPPRPEPTSSAWYVR
jgi:cytochrome c oxidase subunit 4